MCGQLWLTQRKGKGRRVMTHLLESTHLLSNTLEVKGMRNIISDSVRVTFLY